MPKTLIDVTEAAQGFLRISGYDFTCLDKIELDREKQQWILTFNVGVAVPKSKKVVVDDATGQVGPLCEFWETRLSINSKSHGRTAIRARYNQLSGRAG